ncbi:MAG TPA: hypothetical protein VNJ02_10300 [Vicinamibacterales bacterium]|nr:hypothetical protein [Vicinamibacterales bacterium]
MVTAATAFRVEGAVRVTATFLAGAFFSAGFRGAACFGADFLGACRDAVVRGAAFLAATRAAGRDFAAGRREPAFRAGAFLAVRFTALGAFFFVAGRADFFAFFLAMAESFTAQP